MFSKNKLFGTVSLLMMANFLVKFFGLLREMLIANFYGTSIYTDSYIIAHNIPTIFFASIGSAIATTFVPMYSKIFTQEGELRANKFTLNFIKLLFVICFVFTILGEVFTKEVVLIFASGFSGEKLAVTINFVRILFPSIWGMTLFDLFGSYLQQHGKFKPIAFVPIVGNVTIIIFLIVSNILGNIYFFVWGTLLGLLMQLFFYLPWVIQLGLFKAKTGNVFNDKYVKELIVLLLPVFIGSTINEINSIIDKTLVSRLQTGSVSALNYAHKTTSLVVGVIVSSLITVYYPKMAEVAEREDKTEFSERCESIIKIMVSIVVPISLLVILFREEIIRVLFQRGSFGDESTRMTVSSLAYYAIGISAIGVRDILVRIFYCLHNTKVPMINGMISMLANIILDFILIDIMQYAGAAFATSLATIMGVILLLIVLNMRHIVSLKNMKKPLFQTCMSSGIALGISLCLLIFVRSKIDWGIIYLVLCVLIGGLFGLIYIFFQIVLGNSDFKSYLLVFRRMR